MAYFSYIKSIITHKWFVFVAGLRVGGIPVWRLIVHDWQKFTPWEFGAYARKTAAGFHNKRSDEDEAEFAHAWLHHENTAPHHWGYWIPRSGKSKNKPLPMPETYVREMVADWMGAERAYNGRWDMCEWLNNNFSNLRESLHTDTRIKTAIILGKMGYFENKFSGWKYVGK